MTVDSKVVNPEIVDGFLPLFVGYIQAAKCKTEKVFGNLPYFEPIFYIFMEKSWKKSMKISS